MSRKLFVGVPERMYDRILVHSNAVNGSTFFAPSVDLSGGFDDGRTVECSE